MAQLVHTADLDRARLQALRTLLHDAFDGDFEDADFEHSLGGIHAIVWDGEEPVAHGAVVMRRMLHAGRALRCGYVEGVAVRSDRRRHGHGAEVMTALERVIRGAYELGALGASEAGAPLYAALGWRLWTGTTSVLTPSGRQRTPEDDGSIFVLPVSCELDLDGDLACDWRDGDVW